jgi:hypothetical protein
MLKFESYCVADSTTSWIIIYPMTPSWILVGCHLSGRASNDANVDQVAKHHLSWKLMSFEKILMISDSSQNNILLPSQLINIYIIC